MDDNTKESFGYLPSEGELLSGYASRLRVTLSQFEGYAQGHISWYTHYGKGPCWICDLLNMSRYICDILNDIDNELSPKKLKLVAERPKGSYDNTNFEFKIHPKHR